MSGAAAIAALPPPQAPPVGPVGAAGAQLDQGRPSGATHPCFVGLESPVLSGRLIGAARWIAVARADDDRRGLGQGGDVPRRPLQPVRSFGVVPGGDRETARFDQIQVKRLKKRKLMLKDQIAQIESRLLPDIIA